MTSRSASRSADLVVAGSGAAGISAALAAAAAGASVLVITKDLTGGASPLAQGGLAAAIGPGDTAAAHAADTEAAGVGLCSPSVVAALAAGSPDAVDWLVRLGAVLERRDLRLEGGHSAHRVVHSGNDASGAEVHRALLEALLTSGIEVLDRTVALGLALDSGRVAGLTAAPVGPGGALGGPVQVTARSVVLAAGGLGQAFATTSNPPGATGDALALAARAGAVLRDPEFVQFHPTVLYLDGATGQCPLITEALRGAGAVLRDLDGRPVMGPGQDPRGDLAPRDVVAARIHSVISAAGGSGHVWLDATALGAGVLEDGFPTVTAACRKHGIDPVTEPIPVAPGAHYSCGGVRAGLGGRTSVPGLYAIGEAASTGVHGANRLASNSLVEAVIAGRLAGQSAARGSRLHGAQCHVTPPPAELDVTSSPFYGGERHVESQWGGPGGPGGPGGAAHGGRRAELAEAMSQYAGVMRDSDGLEQLLAVIDSAPGPSAAPAAPAAPRSLADVEASSLRTVSSLIAAAALRRAESRGAHRRSDAPETARRARHTLVRYDGGTIHLDWEDL